MSIDPYATGLASFSLDICFDVVPDDTREWNPEIAPQAIVTKSAGNIVPVAKSPFDAGAVKLPRKAGISMLALPVSAQPSIPITETAIIKYRRKLER